MKSITLGREVTSNLSAAGRREWLVTNGLGGFAMGTVAGVLTRRYHGLLIAALDPPLGRTLMVAKLDEVAAYGGRACPLYANCWVGGVEEAAGLRYLERFWLEGAMPVWRFALGDAVLEKRIWMEHGANISYVQYRLVRASSPLALKTKALVNYRDYHSVTRPGSWRMAVEPFEKGLQVTAFDGATPLWLAAGNGRWESRHEWFENFYLGMEEYRGQAEVSDAALHAGDWIATLMPGHSATMTVAAGTLPALDTSIAYERRRRREQSLLSQAGVEEAEPELRQLILAADQFIVQRETQGEENGRSIIAGYPWFGDWGRDTMIALPGLALSTGRHDEAAVILRTFARYVDRGMLPNRFPDSGGVPEYNTADATLWYFEAIRAYYETTGDEELVEDLFPVLAEIVDWHKRGTRYNIRLDPADGLLFAGEPGVQLTWMDAKAGDWVVTPRTGKPVEINALWFNALHILAGFAHQVGGQAGRYERLATQAGHGFARFWYEAVGYCYDVLDGPDGHELALRPNQLLAVSLPHSPLDQEQQRLVVEKCNRALLTSYGLRSLAADHPDYQGHYGGDQKRRDGAYHQGTAWGWLIGPFVDAHFRVYGDPGAAKAFLEPLLDHLGEYGLGSVSEIFDGDPPHTPRGCPFQAWSVGELLRVMCARRGTRPG